ncbi:MAG: SMI1/KNR4 family protein [Pirellulaceae bacterium]
MTNILVALIDLFTHHRELPPQANSSDASRPPQETHSCGSPGKLSARIADRYQCYLPDDLVDWFDGGIWQHTGTSEYCVPVDPNSLLESAPDAIWPGLMPCDFMPLIGSHAGDWLGVRLDRSNNASQVIQWYHGGGDWIPWGRTLSEAIVYDAVCHRLPGPKRRHAVPAEDFQTTPATRDDRLLSWACGHAGIDEQKVVDPDFAGMALADFLLSERIAESAVRCELIQNTLAETLSQSFDRRQAESIGVEWNNAVRWMFDTDLIPNEIRPKLQHELGYTGDDRQDWSLAQHHAEKVVAGFPEIAWGYDLLGYTFEKSGQWQRAHQVYCQGIDKSVFTDQSVKLRTHWTSCDAAKFSAARLVWLGNEHGLKLPASVDQSYLDLLTDKNSERRRVAAQNYWLDRAGKSESKADQLDALVAAGWDLGADPIKAFADILERISHCDESQTARSALAAAHRACFKARYGI